MLRCVKGRNSKLRCFTTVNYSLFVSLKNRGQMAKRSNEVNIIVLNCVQKIIFRSALLMLFGTLCSTAARITHKGRY